MEKNYVSHLECSITGKKYEANKIHGLSDAGRPLLVRYDLQTLKKEVSRDDIKNSKVDGLWRYSPLLPVLDPENRVTLGETITPLIRLNRTVNYSSMDRGVVLFKDEEELSVYPFMIIFNAYQKDDTDDDLLFKDMLAPNYHRDETYTIGQLVGEFGYEYVQIVEDKDEDLSH